MGPSSNFLALILIASYFSHSSTAAPQPSPPRSSLLPKILKPTDTKLEITLKTEFLRHLIKSEQFNRMVLCRTTTTTTSPTHLSKNPRLQEEEEEEETGGGGGGLGGVVNALAFGKGGDNPNNPLDNSNVLVGVNRILSNVFTGNLVGVVHESIGLRSPEYITNVFTEVLSTLFGSTATAGATGIIANLTTTTTTTTTPAPVVNETQQAYLNHVYNQQAYIQNLQRQGVLDKAQAVLNQNGIVQQVLVDSGGSSSSSSAAAILKQKEKEEEFRQMLLVEVRKEYLMRLREVEEHLNRQKGSLQQKQQSFSPSLIISGGINNNNNNKGLLPSSSSLSPINGQTIGDNNKPVIQMISVNVFKIPVASAAAAADKEEQNQEADEDKDDEDDRDDSRKKE